MNIYLDTEFTALASCPDLISIALVSDTNQVFYAELNDYKKPSKWVIQNVLPKLIHDCYMTIDEDKIRFTSDRFDVRDNLEIWLGQFSTCQIVTDTGPVDWLLFLDLLEWRLPPNVFYMPLDISSLFYAVGIDQDINRATFVDIDHQNKHNALDDAHIIKHCHYKLEDLL